MSAENTATRGGRETEKTAEQPSTFQLPSDLASQYQVRVIEPSDGSERRVGMFLPKDRDIPSIEISGNGDRIVARNEDPETIAALVKIAKQNGWEGIDVEGSPEFRKAVWAAGSREGLTVRGYEPEFGEQARMEEQRRSDTARRDRSAPEPTVPTPEQATSMPTREQVAPRPVAEVSETTVATRPVDADRAPASTSAALSDDDRRLLLTLSSFAQDDAAAKRRHESEELAELFLHGAADRISAEPRLANALEAQATMEKHLSQAFDGDASRVTAATLESRQMISDVLRRGLDVSVREPTPVRQIEPPQRTPDLER